MSCLNFDELDKEKSRLKTIAEMMKDYSEDCDSDVCSDYSFGSFCDKGLSPAQISKSIDRYFSLEQKPIFAREFGYITNFIDNTEDIDLSLMNQARALWTSLCLRHDVVVDTANYDTAMFEIWEHISRHEGARNDIEDIGLGYGHFYNFFSEYLV